MVAELNGHAIQLMDCVVWAVPFPDMDEDTTQIISDKPRYNHALIVKDLIAIIRASAEELALSAEKLGTLEK